MFRGSPWIEVLEASLNDRQAVLRRLLARPLWHATPEELNEHHGRVDSTLREIDEICADLAKARGEA